MLLGTPIPSAFWGRSTLILLIGTLLFIFSPMLGLFGAEAAHNPSIYMGCDQAFFSNIDTDSMLVAAGFELYTAPLFLLAILVALATVIVAIRWRLDLVGFRRLPTFFVLGFLGTGLLGMAGFFGSAGHLVDWAHSNEISPTNHSEAVTNNADELFLSYEANFLSDYQKYLDETPNDTELVQKILDNAFFITGTVGNAATPQNWLEIQFKNSEDIKQLFEQPSPLKFGSPEMPACKHIAAIEVRAFGEYKEMTSEITLPLVAGLLPEPPLFWGLDGIRYLASALGAFRVFMVLWLPLALLLFSPFWLFIIVMVIQKNAKKINEKNRK